MQIRTEFPRPTSTIANTFIPLADGTRLAARIWLPKDAEADPVPAILEYIPYRKDDGTAARDALMHPWWAGHGYANVRLDQRGSGDSDGIILDEYTKQEHDDALEVLAWLAAQPWCTGKVGIIGKSWGGFNGLQIAARRPPELGGVISVASTDDRYATDIHYIGGALHGFQKQSWASTMLAYNARPPDPCSWATAGARCGSSGSTRRRPSCTSGSRISAATTSGSTARCARTTRTSRCRSTWSAAGRDGYTDAIFRFMEGYAGRLKGLLRAVGPRLSALGAAQARDRLPAGLSALLGQHAQGHRQRHAERAAGARVDSGVGRAVRRAARRAARPLGRGVRMAAGRPPRADDAAPARRRHPGRGRRTRRRAAVRRSPAHRPGRRRVDGLGLRGRRPARPAGRGRALALLHLRPAARAHRDAGIPGGAADAGLGPAARRSSPCASAMSRRRACRCSSAAASSTSPTVTRTSTRSRSSPARAYEVSFRLNALGHAFQAGHRIRVSLSPTYWPFMWPSPEPVTLTVHAGAASSLSFPVRPPRPEDDALTPFEEPEVAAAARDRAPLRQRPGEPQAHDRPRQRQGDALDRDPRLGRPPGRGRPRGRGARRRHVLDRRGRPALGRDPRRLDDRPLARRLAYEGQDRRA